VSRSIIPGGPVRPAQFILPVIGMLLAFGASGQLPAQASRAPVMGAAGIAVDPAAIRLANATYRAIHAHPELGKQEVATQRLLRSALERIGYTRFVPSELAPTAVIAVLETGRPGPTIALRAEMDARRSHEPEAHDPRSRVPGVMHNCGHDAHAAILLGAADALFRGRERLTGRIVFVFQPAEETRGGADDIVNEGILERLGVQAIFAQHAVSRMPVGTVSASPGPTMAGSNSFTITVTGGQSHAAQPFRGGDVAVAAARIAAAVAELPARRLDILGRPAVISVAYLQAGTADQVNVLPDSAVVRGTIRAFEDVEAPGPAGEPSIAALVRQQADGMAAALGVAAHVTVVKGSPPTVNDPALFDAVVGRLRTAWPGTVDTSPYRGMFSEDFAFYTAKVPSLYFGLGISKDGLGDVDVHQPGFTIHPDALEAGIRLLVSLAALADGPPA